MKFARDYSGGRLARLLFWSAALFALVMALLPPEPGTSLVPDKVQHAIAFGVLGLLGCFAYPRLSPALLVAGLSLFGALIELAQGTSFIHRDCDPMDWLTDTLACIAVVFAVHCWGRSKRSG